MKEFQITENEAGQRFDKYLAKLLRNAPKSFFYKMLRKKNITLNGRKATGNEKINTGDQIRQAVLSQPENLLQDCRNCQRYFMTVPFIKTIYASLRESLPARGISVDICIKMQT